MCGKESDVSADKTASLSPRSFITTLTPPGISYLHRERDACRTSLVWQTAGETRRCYTRVPPGKASQHHSVGLRIRQYPLLWQPPMYATPTGARAIGRL